MEKYEFYKKVIAKYGIFNQQLKAIEEMAELTQAIVKFRFSKFTDSDHQELKEHMLEELADVDIMMDQMKVIYGTNDIESFKVIKLKRLESKIE